MLSIILFLSLHAQSETTLENTTFDLKQIHGAIFDLYFPEDAQLSTTEKKKRIEWRENLWFYLQTKPDVIALLNLLQPTSPLLPDDLKAAFSDVIVHGIENANKERLQQLQYSLRRHPDNNIRKFAATLRKLYSYLTYASPLTSKISGYTNNPDFKATDDACILPATKLQLANNTITHADGIIDYLIIGSGPAGSLIAHELIHQKPGCRVVLIDSGSLIKTNSTITESSSELMESQNMRTTESGGIILRNGQAFGGGTMVNLDLAFSPLLPQIKQQIQTWIDNNLIDASLIHDSQADWKNLQDAYAYVVNRVGTRNVDSNEVNENNKILLSATPTGTTYCLNARKPANDTDKNLKISALEAFIMPSLAQGLSIIPDIKVKKIIFDTKNNKPHASGVEIEFQTPLNKTYSITDPNNFNAASGQTACISAKNIIVCAGTLGSVEFLTQPY
jgi:hypothetical protein